jgi:glycosyltransferase involved in cell wall biosynthesis
MCGRRNAQASSFTRMTSIKTNISLRPRVSVVVPAYNNAGVLRFALESISRQTFRSFEVWVIGDGCANLGEDIVHSFCDPRFFWYNVPRTNPGLSSLINEGLKRARGEYVAFLDEKDLWLPNHLEVLVEIMDMYQTDAALSIIQCVHSDSYSTIHVPLLPDLPVAPELSCLIHKKNILLAKAADLRNESYAEDFLRKAIRENLRIDMVPVTTGLKFLWQSGGALIPQENYLERLQKEPDFINKELSAMLLRREQTAQRFHAPMHWAVRWTRPFQSVLDKLLRTREFSLHAADTSVPGRTKL